ncbi:MAG: MoaD/ThiS family protein [Candidatus Bathyarchaeota archaeon]|nr:MoaD/ThiS family protein [Candidatus Bathyarchaeota archaeon]
MISINVKFFGVLRNYIKRGNSRISLDEPANVETLIIKLSRQSSQFKELIGIETKELSSNIIVIVNGKEVSILNGIQTNLHDGDNIILIPAVHGG